jgi:hypothetical protein
VTCRAFWGRGGNAATHSTEAADLVVAAPQAQQQAYAVVDPAPPQRAYNVRGASQATFLGAGWAALLLVRHLIPPPCWLACATLSSDHTRCVYHVSGFKSNAGVHHGHEHLRNDHSRQPRT